MGPLDKIGTFCALIFTRRRRASQATFAVAAINTVGLATDNGQKQSPSLLHAGYILTENKQNMMVDKASFPLKGGVDMKSVFAAFLCVLIILGMYLISPYRESKQISTVPAVLPACMGVTDYVLLRGTTVEQGRQNLYAEGPAIVDRLYVKPGDEVTQGQPLIQLVPLSPDQQSAGALYEDVQSAVSQISPNSVSVGNNVLNDELAAIVSSAVTGLSQSGEWAEFQPYLLCSPIDGVVMKINCTAGQEISGVLPCISVSDLTQLAIQAQVSESSVSRISEGMECAVTVDALTGEDVLSGQIQSILPYGRQTGTFVQAGEIKTDVLISVSDPKGRLKPGYSAQAKAVVNRKAEALIVPYSCVAQDDMQREYVMIAENGRAIKHYITTGYELEEGLEVVSGIHADQLLICNPEMVEHGDRILIQMEAFDDIS